MTRNIAIGLLALLALGSAHAQKCLPPVNEDCAGAVDITFAQLPLTVTEILGCSNDVSDKPYFDLFYRYDCTVTGMYQLDMCGSFGDSHMRVYTDGCGWGPSSSQVEDDDSCGGADPIITMMMTSGTSYWIEVGAWRDQLPWTPQANDPFLFRIQYLDGAANPWADLGNQLEGDVEPELHGSGSLNTGSPVSIDLSLGPQGALAWLVLGVSTINATFKGGIMVPNNDLILLGVTDFYGSYDITTAWPAGVPSAATFYFQYWIPDASGPVGYVASNAISGTTP
jgi:hypothetical protein